MNYSVAIKILCLGEPFTEKDIRAAYYKAALKFHPDKNDSKEAAERFKEINRAYTYLQEYSNIHVEDDNDLSYLSIIKKCITTMVPELKWDDLFLDTTINNIITDCQKVSLHVFDHLSKEKSLEIYSFLVTYKDILHLSEDILQKMLSIIHSKSLHDNIIILNPNITDLLEDQIYKLDIFNKQFYVPLWHNEVIFDISGNDLIVKSIPELEKNIVIDNDNNVHCNRTISLQDCFDQSHLKINFGEKLFEIPVAELFIREEQIYILQHKGILLADHADLYNTQKRGHIFVHLTLHKKV